MKKYILTYCIFFAHLTYAQNYIYDADTNSPMEAVSIYISDGFGVITNEDGYFELPSQETIDSLYISHLSYTSKTISFQDLKAKDTIFLNPAPIHLDEIVLRQLNPKDTVLKAINSIDYNYSNTPYNTFGFYRQSLTEDTKGIEMIEVEFIGYNTRESVATEIINVRLTDNYSTLGIRTYGGVAAVFKNGDFVKNKAHFLDTDKINAYEFKFDGQIPYQGLEIYKISFYPKTEDVDVLRKGVLFIDAKSLAIVEIRYSYDTEKLVKKAKASEKNLSTKKPLYRLKGVVNLIRYKQLPTGKWTLMYIESRNFREGVFKDKSFDYHLTAKLVINSFKTKSPIKIKTNYNITNDFSKAVKKFNKLSVWDNNYKLSLSKNERQLLEDIQNHLKK